MIVPVPQTRATLGDIFGTLSTKELKFYLWTFSHFIERTVTRLGTSPDYKIYGYRWDVFSFSDTLCGWDLARDALQTVMEFGGRRVHMGRNRKSSEELPLPGPRETSTGAQPHNWQLSFFDTEAMEELLEDTEFRPKKTHLKDGNQFDTAYYKYSALDVSLSKEDCARASAEAQALPWNIDFLGERKLLSCGCIVIRAHVRARIALHDVHIVVVEPQHSATHTTHTMSGRVPERDPIKAVYAPQHAHSLASVFGPPVAPPGPQRRPHARGCDDEDRARICPVRAHRHTSHKLPCCTYGAVLASMHGEYTRKWLVLDP
ncbi:hypothetical protein B0H13DRAFT_1875967 [Mycena leptocephala]|nr:hypothetical protein B0H13DRAFT_1875967 [Mycena leptocephala]